MVFGGLGIAYNFFHQVFTAAGAVIAISVYLISIAKFRVNRQVRGLLTVAILVLIGQGLLGQVMVGSERLSTLRGVHFALSVIALGALAGSAVLVWFLLKNPGDQIEILRDNFSRQATVLVLAAFAALISGVYLAESGLGEICSGWLFCFSNWPPSGAEWFPLVHRLIVGIVAIFFFRFTGLAWKQKRSNLFLLPLVTSLFVLYLGQAYTGALVSLRGNVDGLAILHAVSSALIVVTGGLVLVGSAIQESRHTGQEEKKLDVTDKNQRVKDFFALNKPIVVLLLLATTFGGMVMGYGGVPPIRIVLVTLVAGGLAAGGSGAVNQYIDKELDVAMTRTSNRPIPAGRLTPAEGLAYGVGAMLIAFFMLAGLVNMLSALLSLGGMFYYVFLYSIILKKRSVQNIVIGGGAGAIPPLVGWAASTGTLNLTAGFLFLIIFLWTPPHFWALALTRKNEYAAAGVPMMPVERGNTETERLILIYSIVLVLTTIMMWILGLTGWLFLVSAIVLGGYLIWLSWQVYHGGRNKVYYRMYRHSNYYLLLLFIFLAIDSVLI
jgi:protoheme IX farnesyltransferase